ncbi:hypothetical protein [Streptomyces sp. NBC_01367]|uniref:hypothetical protein n=1 Tax=Streptomyces sp. NBC_01367 TaxID=2903841 RepID=UPI0038639DCD
MLTAPPRPSGGRAAIRTFPEQCAGRAPPSSARRFLGFTRTRAGLPFAGLTGAALVLGSDVLLRAVVRTDLAVAVPTGVVISLVRAVFRVTTAVLAAVLVGVLAGAGPMTAVSGTRPSQGGPRPGTAQSCAPYPASVRALSRD